jgi:hypothetical protein
MVVDTRFLTVEGSKTMHYGRKTNVDCNHRPYGPKKGAQASIKVLEYSKVRLLTFSNDT